MRARSVGTALALLVGCEGPMRVGDPAGPAGEALFRLIVFFVVVTGVPAALFLVALLVAVAKKRRPSTGRSASDPKESRIIIAVGGGVTGVLLVGLMVVSFETTGRIVDPPSEPQLAIDFVGHQFWWEARYRDAEFVTANEIHIPVGVPVRFHMRTADVIHSFWVPKLHGKIDMIPGRTHRFWLEADRVGEFRGICAEFCGIQHALMAFLVIVETEAEFDAWFAAQREPQTRGADGLHATGRAIFERARCHLCHVIRGSFDATQQAAGPDLTHFASRRTLGAGTAPRTAANVERFVRNPHALKPGVRMPPSDLSEADARALVAYLESLE